MFIGFVTSAAAAPLRTSRTAASIAPMMAGASPECGQPGWAWIGRPTGETGSSVAEHRRRLLRMFDGSDRDVPAKPFGQCAEPLGIVNQIKRRRALTAIEPGPKRDLAADPGRLPHRHGEGKGHRTQTLRSTKAVRRKSRMYRRANVSRRWRIKVSPISSRVGTVGALGAIFSQTMMTPTPFF